MPEVTVAELRQATEAIAPRKTRRKNELPDPVIKALALGRKQLDHVAGAKAGAEVTARLHDHQIMIEVIGVPLARAGQAFRALASAFGPLKKFG